VVLVAIIVIIAIVHFNSEAYWGKQFYRVYSSPYLTDKEREKISRDVHAIAILPNEFEKESKLIKEQIKKSKAILKERKKEKKMNEAKGQKRTIQNEGYPKS
jgi:N12 class adenine-specific DNA methylase